MRLLASVWRHADRISTGLQSVRLGPSNDGWKARRPGGRREGRGRTQATWPEADAPRTGEVVVLGGTGFIGRRVVARLVAEEQPVTLVARRAHGLAPELRAAIDSGRVRLVRGSLEEPASIAAALDGAHAVIQLATGSGNTWEELERSMVGGSVAVAEASLARGVKRFVYVSSIAALYTGDDAKPELEDSLGVDPQPTARSTYSRGKIEAERALLRLHRDSGLPLTIARPGVVVGDGTPMQHSGYGVWPRDNHCIGWGLGEHPLPLVWVDDVADALAKLAVDPRDELSGRAVNLCARTGLSARDMVNEYRRVTGRDIHFHPRSCTLSQALEVGKWVVKVAGRRPGTEFPSWRDLKARALHPAFTSRTARELLDWKPTEDREEFLDRTVRIFAPERAGRRTGGSGSA